MSSEHTRRLSPAKIVTCLWVGLGMSILLAGCDSGGNSLPSASSSVRSPATASGAKSVASAAGLATPRRGPSGKEAPGQGDQAKMVQIEGDRLAVIPAPVVLTKQTESSPFRFAEIAQDAGIDFVHFSGMTDDKHFPTANGSGVAVFDYDNDGLLDIYFATATLLPLGTAEKGPNRLYKNLGGNHFKDVTEASGLGYRGFCHGIISGDIDNDGDQDVFLCNYGPNVLYLNNGNGTFKDISEQAGIAAPHSAGLRIKLLADDAKEVPAEGKNLIVVGSVDGVLHLRIFDRDGEMVVDTDEAKRPHQAQQFSELKKQLKLLPPSQEIGASESHQVITAVTAIVGQIPPNWSSSGAMLDFDNDGYLDIYVSNYGRWVYPDDHRRVGDEKKKVWLYTSPRVIKTVKHLFFRNNGNLTFTDVYDRVITVEKEINDPKTNEKKRVRVPEPRNDGHGFGVVAADLNNDGLIDLYVANDMNPNFLFLNRGDGTFDDVSEISGAAYDINGMAQSGMGVDAEDVDGDKDGLPELIVTNFTNEYATLYQNFGNGVFYDNTAFFGLASDTMPWVKWGCALADFDNDGWPDFFLTNGHVDNNRRLLGQPVDYEEIPLLFRNLEGKRFRISTRDVGTYFDTKHVARGAAFGDIDNDGDIDIAVNHKDGHAALLRNDTKTKNHWIRFVLQGTKSNRDAIGTKLEIVAGGRTIYRQRKGGYSMMGTNDHRVLVGVGPATIVDKVTIRWPSGILTTLENLKVDQDAKVIEPKDGKIERKEAAKGQAK
ncbi:MAG: CRTAC1 family protein [Isosphaeraceae bacterium]